ncbi:hypothetical protein J7I98_08055 [Streptomyces sp. ISL-98]|nr:hypothetical protein [Streptomyces sp. ISL-98]
MRTRGDRNPDEVAPGWESDDGRVVVLSEQDLADLPLPSSPKAIEVLAFVPPDRIDPMLQHKPYHLGVGDPAAARPYALLRDPMRESGLVAVVRVTLRTRESLALLRVRDQVIGMQTLLWPDELRGTEDVAVPYTVHRAAATPGAPDGPLSDGRGYRRLPPGGGARRLPARLGAGRGRPAGGAWSRPVPPIPCRSEAAGSWT